MLRSFPSLSLTGGKARPIKAKKGIIIFSGDMVLVVVFDEVTKLAVKTALL
jgi:hypothetical protein